MAKTALSQRKFPTENAAYFLLIFSLVFVACICRLSLLIIFVDVFVDVFVEVFVEVFLLDLFFRITFKPAKFQIKQ